MFVTLKPLSERTNPPTRWSTACAPSARGCPEPRAFSQADQDLRIGGRMSSAQYQYTIQSDNLQDLTKWGPILLQK